MKITIKIKGKNNGKDTDEIIAQIRKVIKNIENIECYLTSEYDAI